MKSKEKLHRIELFIAVALLIVLIGIVSINYVDFSKTTTSLPIPTAFASSELVSQDLDLEIDQSQVYELSTTSAFNLTSLRLSGFIEGYGPIKIFLEDSSNSLLVYSNIQKKQRSKDLITGLATEKITFTLTPSEILSPLEIEIADSQELIQGDFHNQCVETCFIDFSFSQNENYKLLFYIGENVRLKVSKIMYTIG